MALGPDFRPYRLVGYALALAILVVSISEYVQNARNPTDRDFISFWGAAQLAMAGNPAAAYNNELLHAAQRTAASFAGGGLPFPYPPAFLLLVMPFALLSFPVGMAVWAIATFPFYFFAVRRMFPDSGWLAAAFPPVFVGAVIGQNSFVMGALFVGGLVLMRSRPFAAGLVLGCLILKPQLALLLPVAVLASRQWRTMFGAALSSVGVLLLGIVIFGVGATTAWIEQMPLFVSIARDGLVGWSKLASVYAAARQAGLDAGVAMTIHALIAGAAAIAVWKVWRSDAELTCKAAVLATGTMLVSPYLFLYDAVILVVPFLWLAKNKGDPALLSLLWWLPLFTIAQIAGLHGPANLNPVTPIALLILICHRVWATSATFQRVERPALA